MPYYMTSWGVACAFLMGGFITETFIHKSLAGTLRMDFSGKMISAIIRYRPSSSTTLAIRHM